MNEKHPFAMNDLDRKLNSPSQQTVAKAVSALPEDELSLSWRSQLNSQIMEMAAQEQKRKRRVNFLWRPAFGLGLAGIFAVAFLVRPQGNPSASAVATLEGSLVQHHRESVGTFDLVGYGLSPVEATATGSVNNTPEWNESDLESL